MSQQPIGEVFGGDFRVQRLLKEGGMGAVYVAHQLSTGKLRALKVLLPQHVSNAALHKRFVQEARVGAQIASEHVVEVLAAGVASGHQPWLAMELLEGENLEERITRSAHMSPSEVLNVFEQLCHAVAAAHRAGIVHRDLKPDNIFLARSRRVGTQLVVKVLDFGIAKIVAESAHSKTAPIGTPLWMAPEQTEARPITPAVDIWSLGLIAFYLLTGRCFWVGATSEGAALRQLLREIVLDPIPAASRRAAELGTPGRTPASFDAWFARCVDRLPTQRFGSADELLAGLHSALEPPPLHALHDDAEATTLWRAGPAQSAALKTKATQGPELARTSSALGPAEPAQSKGQQARPPGAPAREPAADGGRGRPTPTTMVSSTTLTQPRSAGALLADATHARARVLLLRWLIGGGVVGVALYVIVVPRWMSHPAGSSASSAAAGSPSAPQHGAAVATAVANEELDTSPATDLSSHEAPLRDPGPAAEPTAQDGLPQERDAGVAPGRLELAPQTSREPQRLQAPQVPAPKSAAHARVRSQSSPKSKPTIMTQPAQRNAMPELLPNPYE